MPLPSFISEITFITARSGGAGGQNVNKVETAVTGYWKPADSHFFTEEQKNLLAEKLQNRMNTDGAVFVKSQVHRSQMANKTEVIGNFVKLVEKALHRAKPRIATRPSKGQIQHRLDNKKRKSELKQLRSKISW
jgi:ribosome-associated protein